jgi:hypothetical protein
MDRIEAVRRAKRNIPIPKTASVRMGFRPTMKLLGLSAFDGGSN